MEMDNYLQHYEDFDKEFCPQATVADVECKMLEEMGELQSCLQWPEKSTPEETVGELLDVMNVSIKLLKRYGIHDPLFFGVQKLEATALKYRAMSKLKGE